MADGVVKIDVLLTNYCRVLERGLQLPAFSWRKRGKPPRLPHCRLQPKNEDTMGSLSSASSEHGFRRVPFLHEYNSVLMNSPISSTRSRQRFALLLFIMLRRLLLANLYFFVLVHAGT